MMYKFWFSLCVAAIVALVSIGCKPKEGANSDDASSGDSNATSAEGDKDAEIKASLAKLDDADRALAEKQKLCPVSDKPLGSMDVPVKVTVEGKDVFLCCSGCEDSIKQDPQKYLAKLPQ